MASQRIKGITIELGADASKFTKALAEVDKMLNSTQKNLKDLNNALKLDPTNVNLIKDKQRELGDQIQETESKIRTEKEALEAMKNTEGFDKNSKAARDLQTQIDLDTSALKQLKKEAQDCSTVFGTAMKAVGEKVTEVGNKIKSVGDSIAQVGQDITTKVTVPIVTAFGGAIKVTADFDAQMSKVQAISGATGEEFQTLRANAREMGEQTKFSATEAGQAYEYMGMAGWTAQEMIQGLPGILNLAAASGEELGTTSDIVTDALTAFGLEASDSAHFSDVLAAAATNANTNVSMMGESFKYVAPVAGSLNYSIEDIALALGLMANSGIKADMAGTSLRNMMQRMAKPTKESQMAMDRLGLSLADDEGNMYSFREIMDQLRGAFTEINMSAEDYDAALTELDNDLASGALTQKQYNAELEELNKQAFGAEGAEKARAAAMLGGTRAMSGLLAIANTSQEEYDELANALDHASDKFAMLKDGSVVPLSEALASGAEVIKEYNGQAEAMADQMLNNLSGDITILKSKLQELAISFGDLLMPTIRTVVEKVQEFVDKLNALDDAQKEQIIKIAAIVAAIGPALLIVGKVIGAIGTIVASVGNVIRILGVVVNVIGAIGAPIAILIAGLAALAAAFVYFYQTDEEFAAKVDEAIAGVKEAFAEMYEIVQPVLEELRIAFNELMEELKPVFEFLMECVAGFLEGVLSAVPTIIEAVKGAVTFVTELIKAFGAYFTGDTDAAFEHVKNAVKGLMDFWENMFKAKLDVIIGFFNHFGIDLKAKANEMVSNLKARWTELKTNTINMFNEMLNNANTTFNNMKAGITSRVNEIKDNIVNGIKGAVEYITSLPSRAWNWGADIVGGIAEGIRDTIDNITDAIEDVADVIASYIHFSEPDVGPLSNFHTFMPDMMEEMAQGINKGIPMLKDAMGDMASTLVPSSMATSGVTNTRNVTANNTFNITVNGAGKDVFALADELTEIIQDNINAQVYNQEAVYA